MTISTGELVERDERFAARGTFAGPSLPTGQTGVSEGIDVVVPPSSEQ